LSAGVEHSAALVLWRGWLEHFRMPHQGKELAPRLMIANDGFIEDRGLNSSDLIRSLPAQQVQSLCSVLLF